MLDLDELEITYWDDPPVKIPDGKMM